MNTHIVPGHKRADMHQFVIREIAAHTTQVFYVVPRIGNPDEDDADGVQCAEHVYKELKSEAFALHSCALVHGRTPNEEQERIMDTFKSGSIDVLVSNNNSRSGY